MPESTLGGNLLKTFKQSRSSLTGLRFPTTEWHKTGTHPELRLLFPSAFLVDNQSKGYM